MAMLPFIGYDAGDYLNHWVNLSAKANPERLPKIFLVNWFRRTAEGGFAWPGFGDNSRVLKWAIERIEGKADAVETPIGYVPTGDSMDLTGLDMTPAQVEDAVRVDPDEWATELASIEEWYANFGDSLPEALQAELDGLKAPPRLDPHRSIAPLSQGIVQHDGGPAPLSGKVRGRRRDSAGALGGRGSLAERSEAGEAVGSSWRARCPGRRPRSGSSWPGCRR